MPDDGSFPSPRVDQQIDFDAVCNRFYSYPGKPEDHVRVVTLHVERIEERRRIGTDFFHLKRLPMIVLCPDRSIPHRCCAQL